MPYTNSRAITINKVKVPSDQTNFPLLFTTLCDTLSSGINNSTTTIPVTNGVQIADGDFILIDSEKILITAGGGTASLTGLRAQLGTSAASHLAAAVITNLFLASVANGGGVINASGFDIIFASDALGASPVAYERVIWTASQGLTEAHVLSQPTSAVNAVMYVLWGNAAITTDQSNPTGVWDSNFLLVAHYPDGSFLSVADSTAQNTGTNNGGAAAAGEIDGAVVLNGSSQFVDYGNAVSNVTNATMEAWINPSDTHLGIVVGNQDGTNGYTLFTEVGGSLSEFLPVVQAQNAGSTSFAIPNLAGQPTIGVGKWSYIAGRCTLGAMSIFTDGVNLPQQTSTGTGQVGSTTTDLRVGRYGTSAFFFPGTIDEVRVSKIARSDDWIATCYNTQGFPNTFYALGANTPITPVSRVTQAIVEIMILQNPNARVTQAIVEIMVLPYTPPPPIPGGSGAAITGGNGAKQRSKGGCNPKVTHYDACLEREAMLMRLIKFPPSCSIPKEYCNLLPWDDTYGATPEQSFPFLKQRGIVTPPTGLDHVVVSFNVKAGYDGLLSGFYFQYSGSGFSQGSGDIIWRIKINQRYVKDLSNVPFLLGDPVNPIPMTQGQIITPGQQIEAIVSIPNLSGMIQIGNSTVYAGLLGFFWPR